MSGMEPGGHADHAHPHAGEDGMGMAMSMVFNTSTKVTLFFSSWSTTTVTSYVFTLIFLFALAVFNRFLGALKFQLDMRRTEPASSLSPVPKLDLPTARRRRNPPPKDRVSPLPRYLDVNGDNTEHDGPLPSAPFLGSDSERTWDGLYSSQTEESQDLTARFGSWSSRGHWSWRQDGTSSLLEGVRALVGYAL